MTTSDLMPQNGTMKPHSVNLRHTLPFDGGNRFIKYLNAWNRPVILPSFIKELKDWEEGEAGDRTVLIEFDNRRYLIGETAQLLNGTPVFTGDKCELAEILGLAALEPNPGSNSILVERMAIALPDRRVTQSVQALKRLEGTREFTRNGQHIVATVRSVEPVDECLPAYRFAIAKGLFIDPKRINGILDLGGGTGIGRLFAGGNIARDADCILPGTFDLANKIANAITPKIGYSPDLSLIMDGIAEGSYQLGTTGFDFENIFTSCKDEWIAEIRSRLKVAWVKYLPTLAEVLVIGGSAWLAEDLQTATKGRFKIAQHPSVPNFAQLISLLGMAMEGK